MAILPRKVADYADRPIVLSICRSRLRGVFRAPAAAGTTKCGNKKAGVTPAFLP
jgi:hypothetical protein